jgi:hypothetical protein
MSGPNISKNSMNGNASQPTAAAAEEQTAVDHQAVAEAALPADALVPERREVLGGLGPADRIRNKRNPIRSAALPHQAMEANHQLHVFADGVGAVAAHFDHDFFFEEAERPGDDEDGVQRGPAEAVEQERAEVLDDLKQREGAPRQPHPHQEAAADVASVGNPDRAARGDGGWVFQERPDDPRQAVSLEDRVRVDTAEERIAGDVDPRVQGIRLAAVLLIEHPQVGVHVGMIDGADRLDGSRFRYASLKTSSRNSAIITSIVASFDPSLTTMTS